MNQLQNDSEDTFAGDVRTNMLHSMLIVFGFIPFQTHYDEVVTLIKSNSQDSAKIKSLLFMMSSLIPDYQFLVNFREVLEIILNISTDIPLLLIEKCCKSLHDVTEYYYHLKHIHDIAKISFEFICNGSLRCQGQPAKL
ncbi:hypothetical protein RF11_00447 [Thelohanellus kitauei]|uniref:Uncharacterized protein n=1 Tax=Thelohanellus kitauei TaxID=669202 RepID=A0A0C2MZP2_THEKT|nr:hypothetical protein RF11_00447 [Thelohanellus kitauei]